MAQTSMTAVLGLLVLGSACTRTGIWGLPDTPEPTPTPEVFDCALVPDLPLSETTIQGARGYHGLAFDDQGNILGNDNGALIRATYQGQTEVFVPGVGQMEQIAYLDNWDLVASSASDGSLYRISPNGSQTPIVSNLNAYGVLVDPNQNVWTAGWEEVTLVDTEAGTRTVVENWPQDPSAHSLNFSPDLSRLYVGSVAWNANGGTVYYFDLDADLNVVGGRQVFAEPVGEGWHDAVAVDVCGNLYVPDYWSSSLYRIRPNGDVTRILDWSSDSNKYGHGAVFGSGIGGWREDAIYLPMPYNGNRVKEVVLGVPSRKWKGRVINAPSAL